MTEREKIINILKGLQLPTDQYYVSGSGTMVMHGVEREQPMGDLDLFCSTALWFHLYESISEGITWGLYLPDPDDPSSRADPPYLFYEMLDLEINVFFAWRIRDVGNIDVNFQLERSVIIDGYPCMPLEDIYKWKSSVMREKDEPDLRAIEAYFKEHA